MKDFLTCAFAALSCMVLAEQAAFVESTGNQHFDTGVVPNAQTRVVADVQYVVAPGSGVAVNGWQAKDSQEVFVFGLYDRVNQHACFSESGTDFLAGENSDQGLAILVR